MLFSRCKDNDFPDNNKIIIKKNAKISDFFFDFYNFVMWSLQLSYYEKYFENN